MYQLARRIDQDTHGNQPLGAAEKGRGWRIDPVLLDDIAHAVDIGIARRVALAGAAVLRGQSDGMEQ